jgi:hypothetical protein
MAQLTIIYDELDPPLQMAADPNMPAHMRPKVASLPLADDLGDIDIYEVARRLAEMMLEQMQRESPRGGK